MVILIVSQLQEEGERIRMKETELAMGKKNIHLCIPP